MTDNQQTDTRDTKVSTRLNLTLDTVILIVLGIFMILFGLLGFLIRTGSLPYNPDGTYGLLLIIISLQVITLGKTPFGTLRRSWILVLLGIGFVIPGTIACFIPGLIGEGIRLLVSIIMVTGGIILFLQLVFDREKARRWIHIPGILQHLTIACGLVYLIEILFGLVSLKPDLISGLAASVIGIIFGISLLYLAWAFHQISRTYPQKKTGKTTSESPGNPLTENERLFLLRDASLSTQISVMILLGVIFVLFSLLLVPISHGIIPFSRQSQFGLLTVIMAIQILALGKTPFGVCERSWPLILVGMVVVSIGIYCCIIPGVLTWWMLIPLGTWNTLTGSVGIGRLVIPMLSGVHHSPKSTGPGKRKFKAIVALLYIMTLSFGINLFVPGIIPGMAIPVIIFFLGFLLLVLAYILVTHPVPGKADRIN